MVESYNFMAFSCYFLSPPWICRITKKTFLLSLLQIHADDYSLPANLFTCAESMKSEGGIGICILCTFICLGYQVLGTQAAEKVDIPGLSSFICAFSNGANTGNTGGFDPNSYLNELFPLHWLSRETKETRTLTEPQTA